MFKSIRKNVHEVSELITTVVTGTNVMTTDLMNAGCNLTGAAEKHSSIFKAEAELEVRKADHRLRAEIAKFEAELAKETESVKLIKSRKSA